MADLEKAATMDSDQFKADILLAMSHLNRREFDAALAYVLRKHLQAFGPASLDDIAGWSGESRVRAVRQALAALELRSEERRVGKECPRSCRSRWSR